MIDAIHGKMVYLEENMVIIGTESIDFSCVISSATSSHLSNLAAEDKEALDLFIYLQHKKDSMKLYGFSTRDERSMFFEITRVQGIGPKQAVKILSGIDVKDLIIALDAGDVDRLIRIPGLGKKTAQKMILTLRNKLEVFSDSITSKKISGSLSPLCRELIHALTEMGYDKKAAKQAVEESYQELKDTEHDERILEEKLFKASMIKLA